MLRVRNLDAALEFYCDKLGLREIRRRVDENGRYTLVFLAAPDDEPQVRETAARFGRDAPLVELTYNWDTEEYGEARFFGHLAYEVDDIYATCARLMQGGVTINRPPRDGRWRSCAPQIIIRSNCCRRVRDCRRRNLGARCRIPAAGSPGVWWRLLARFRKRFYTPYSRRPVPQGALPHLSSAPHLSMISQAQ